MSSTNAAFGLRASYHPSGTIRPDAGTIASAYGSDIYRDQPVKLGTDGTVQAAGASDAIVGAFAGCQYVQSGSQRPVVSNFWPANTVATDIVAYYLSDPSIVYEIQADGSVAQSQTGEEANFTNVTASNGLGMSKATISATTSSSVAGVLRVIGITPGPNNAWGDNYVIVQVQISEHQNVADVADY